MRTALVASGLVGLAIDLVLTWVGLRLRAWEASMLLPVWASWAAFIVLLGLSVTDFPVMLLMMRRMEADPKRRSHWPLSLINVLFVSFSGVYGLVGMLLTGLLLPSLALSGLGLARMASSLILIRSAVLPTDA